MKKTTFQNLFTEALCQFGIAFLYVSFAWITHKYLNENCCHTAWLSNGIALSVMLIGGWRYLYGTLVGMIFFHFLTQDAFVDSSRLIFSSVFETGFGFWLISRYQIKTENLLPYYINVVGLGSLASLVGAIFCISIFSTPELVLKNIFMRWMDNSIGILLAVPFALSWRNGKAIENKLESLFIFAMAILAGQIAFLNAFHEFLGDSPKGYTLFFFMTVVAIRIGMRGVTLLLLIIATQALIGAYQKIGFFSHDIDLSQLRNYALYLVIQFIVGLSISSYIEKVNRMMVGLKLKDHALNFAANSIVITDVEGHIEWANQAFTNVTGFSSEEAKGFNPRQLVKSGKQDNDFYKTMWNTILANHVWRGELVNRRKDGTFYDEEMTITPITDEQGNISHFVAVKQDVTERKLSESLLKESEHNFREAKENLENILSAATGFAIIATDKDGLITMFNRGAELMLGYSADEMVGKCTPAQIHLQSEVEQRGLELSDTLQKTVSGFAVFVEKANVLGQETREWTYIRKDKTMLTVSLSVTAVRNEKHEITGYLGISRDITSRKLAEQKLKQNETRLRSIIDISPVPLALNDDKQNITFLNRTFIETFGYDLDDIPTLETWWQKAYPDEDYREWVVTTWQQTLQIAEKEHKAFAPLEVVVHCKNGSQKTVLASAAMISESLNGQHLVALYDITERKNLELELQKNKERLLLSQKYGGIGSWEANLIDGTQIWSSTIYDLIKIPDDDNMPTWETFLNFIHIDDRQKVIDATAAHLNRNEKYDVEYRIITGNGEIRWFRSVGRAEFENDGTPSKFIGIAQDITERKNLELDLKRSNANLEQFAYAVSHDMRQPLRMVTSYLSLIEKALQSQLDEDTQQFLNFAVDGAKRMDTMILSLLDYSRVGQQTHELKSVSARAALNEALMFLNPALEFSRGKVEISGDWIDLIANFDDLTRLFQNLIGNALKYHKENEPPVVSVTATVLNTIFRVEVKDSGIGIDPNQIERLFKVFSRLKVRSEFEGTGIGLALCRKIIEQHYGGRIGVTSEGEGQGSTFWFEIPRLSFLSKNNSIKV